MPEEIQNVLRFLGQHDLSPVLRERGWYHSMSFPDGGRIEGVQPEEVLRARLATFPIPEDLRGKRVLDIGAWDGWFSFEMERRGASVVAIDVLELDTFHYARKRLGSKVEYHEMDLYHLSPESFGMFDIVLCLGVYYHLKHPLLGLQKVCSVTRDLAIVEGFVADDAGRVEGRSDEIPWMHFYETTELGGQNDNWFGPTSRCVQALCRTAGFTRVQQLYQSDQRAAQACYRHWPAGHGTERAPELLGVVNHRTKGRNFSTQLDDYVCCWMKSPVDGLTRESVFPEVDSFGVMPVQVIPMGEGIWQVAFIVPPGLSSGWRQVRLRTSESLFSNAMGIALDLPLVSDGIGIEGAAESGTWRPDAVAAGRSLALWIRGLPEHADSHNLRIRLEGLRLPVLYLSAPDAAGLRQVNVQVETEAPQGEHRVQAAFGTAKAERLIRVD